MLWQTLCGQLVVETATHPDEVTCKKCRRVLRKSRPDNVEAASYVEAVFGGRRITFDPPPALIDPTSDLPVVSRFTWGTIRDRFHWCGHCAVCVWFTQIEADHAASPWRKRHPPPRVEPFRSTKHALEWYMDRRLHGTPLKAQDTGRIGKLGTLVQGGRVKDAQAIQEADDLHAIQQSLDKAYRSESKRGLSRAERMFILFAVARGEKAHRVARALGDANPKLRLNGPMVAAIARAGEWEVYEELRSRGMVPAW